MVPDVDELAILLRVAVAMGSAGELGIRGLAIAVPEGFLTTDDPVVATDEWALEHESSDARMVIVRALTKRGADLTILAWTGGQRALLMGAEGLEDNPVRPSSERVDERGNLPEALAADVDQIWLRILELLRAADRKAQAERRGA